MLKSSPIQNSSEIINFYDPELENKISKWGENYSHVSYGSIDLKNKVINYPSFESPDLFKIFEFLISKAPKNSYAEWYAFGCSVYYSFHDGEGKVYTISKKNEDDVNRIKNCYQRYEVIRKVESQYIF